MYDAQPWLPSNTRGRRRFKLVLDKIDRPNSKRLDDATMLAAGNPFLENCVNAKESTLV